MAVIFLRLLFFCTAGRPVTHTHFMSTKPDLVWVNWTWHDLKESWSSGPKCWLGNSDIWPQTCLLQYIIKVKEKKKRYLVLQFFLNIFCEEIFLFFLQRPFLNFISQLWLILYFLTCYLTPYRLPFTFKFLHENLFCSFSFTCFLLLFAGVAHLKV